MKTLHARLVCAGQCGFGAGLAGGPTVVRIENKKHLVSLTILESALFHQRKKKQKTMRKSESPETFKSVIHCFLRICSGKFAVESLLNPFFLTYVQHMTCFTN